MSVSPLAISRPWNVAVLFGGPSAEREVSLDSGREIAAALERRGHQVTAIDPGPTEFEAQATLRHADWKQFDGVFIALHGTFGEDGTVQRFLDAAGVPYTGSDAESSRIAFSKSAAKERFDAEGIATPAYVLVNASDPRSRAAFHAAQLGYPIVVKPDAQGSSLGVSIVRWPDELPAALEKCFALGPFGLLERYVAGTEWTVGFLGPRALPPMCVSTDHDFLDFDAKYRDESTSVSFDGQVSREVVAGIRATASRACRALDATGACRVDLRVDEQGVAWLLEVNTLPGFTSHSAVPTAAARIGIDFDELCEQVLAMSLTQRAKRHAA
ncbi:MAG: D-alanine--D-alanine ligase [Planctomycetota bacterium]|nr:D-alanine--D-alanine ligase [Planctomycetaceae bacterium]MDQ3332562.1 D-alanine--D-alanine ligase [Planctomycetota bacterium]